VTGFDIAPTGDRFVALTYVDAWEFALDLSSRRKAASLRAEEAPHVRVPLRALNQQEAIAYLDDSTLLYDSERGKKEEPAPLMRIGCARKLKNR
jgi:hypothetical protein